MTKKALKSMTDAELILLRWKLLTDTNEKEKYKNIRHRRWIAAELKSRKSEEVQDLQGNIQPDGEHSPDDLHEGELYTGECEGSER